MRLSLIYDKPNTVVDELLSICQAYDLPLDWAVHRHNKLNDKQILQLKQTGDTPIIAILKNTPTLIKSRRQNNRQIYTKLVSTSASHCDSRA